MAGLRIRCKALLGRGSFSEAMVGWWDGYLVTRPGKLTKSELENHHFSWENPLFLWPFSIAMLVYQRVPNIGD